MPAADSFYYSPDWSTDEVFLSAAVNGDVATLRRMVAEGVDVDTRDKEGVTALLRAANAERPEAVRYLLAAGADRGARDRGGRSLVHLAAAYPRMLPVLAEVLAAGASPDDQFEGGVTPLMTALLRGHLDGARALLARGADPRLRDRHGDTAVIHMLAGIYAFRDGQDHRAALEVLEELLRLGVDPLARGQYGRDAMAVAASKGLRAAMAVLRRYGSSIENADADGLTPLQQAWWGGQQAQIDWLLGQGVAVDFFSAVALGRVDQVAAALDRDPDLLQRPLKAIRSAPLSIALHAGQPAMVKFLLDSGADPNGPDSAGGSLMHAVRRLPDPAVLKLLIAHGADLEACDGDRNTALNYAARDDKLDLARILLDADADPNAQTERGYTVLQFARGAAMQALLRKYGGR